MAASARSTSIRLLSSQSCALQVSKGLLDTAMKAPQRPQRPTISSPAVSGPEEICWPAHVQGADADSRDWPGHDEGIQGRWLRSVSATIQVPRSGVLINLLSRS